MVKKSDLTKRYKRVVQILWIILIAGLSFSVLFVYSIRINFANLYGGFPSYKSFENPTNELSSLLYSADNVLLGSYYRKNRSQAQFDDLAPELVNTLIYTEDVRFYEHSGISFEDLMRVAIKTLYISKLDSRKICQCIFQSNITSLYNLFSCDNPNYTRNCIFLLLCFSGSNNL